MINDNFFFFSDIYRNDKCNGSNVYFVSNIVTQKNENIRMELTHRLWTNNKKNWYINESFKF